MLLAGEDNEATVNKEMGLLEKELKTVHDVSGKKWRHDSTTFSLALFGSAGALWGAAQ